MSNPQTVLFPIDIPYKDNDGAEKVRKCVLTLAISFADVASTSLEEEGLGEITIQGAVMPIDDPKGGASSTATAPEVVVSPPEEEFAEAA